MNQVAPSILAAINHSLISFLDIFAKVKQIICPSKALYDLAVRAGVSKSKLHVLPHFISEEQRKLASCNTLIPSSNYFLYVGRLDQEKGVHFLIEAFKRMPKECQLKIVGDGYERGKLEAMAATFQLDNIEFCGKLSGEALNSAYSGAIATIFPSNCFETFGLTILESYLHAKPVIASRLAAMVELVKDGETGLLVDPASPGQLYQAMQQLWENKAVCKQLGVNGFELVSDNFGSSDYFNRLNRLIEALIKNN
jgi:glycosyltransferase involved in cell wall biosynthesis